MHAIWALGVTITPVLHRVLLYSRHEPSDCTGSWSQLKTLKVKTLTTINLTVTVPICNRSRDCSWKTLGLFCVCNLYVFFLGCVCLWLKTEQWHCRLQRRPSFSTLGSMSSANTTATTSCKMRLVQSCKNTMYFAEHIKEMQTRSAHAIQTHNQGDS